MKTGKRQSSQTPLSASKTIDYLQLIIVNDFEEESKKLKTIFTENIYHLQTFPAAFLCTSVIPSANHQGY